LTHIPVPGSFVSIPIDRQAPENSTSSGTVQARVRMEYFEPESSEACLRQCFQGTGWSQLSLHDDEPAGKYLILGFDKLEKAEKFCSKKVGLNFFERLLVDVSFFSGK
jgi:hypothetical protein